MKFRILPAILGIISISAIAQPASADVYKATVGGKTKVYLSGFTPSSSINYQVYSAPKVKSLILNNCGLGKFKESTTAPVTSMDVGGQAVTIGANGGIPACTKDATTGVYSATNDVPLGQARRTGDGYIWYKGANSAGASVLNVVTLGTKIVKTNQCGLASFSPAFGVTDFLISQQPFSISSLPTKTYPSVCKNVGGTYVTYDSAPFPPPGG